MKRALFSVSDKREVAHFARALRDLGWEVIATGGTQRLLEGEGIPVTGITEVTGFPEICGGRVKTLHPAVHGALLARRDDREHMGTLKGLGILPIDLVCVNLYPFRETVARAEVTLAEATEQIDIGGPSMLRSAAKNNASVTVVCDPGDYEAVLEQVAASGDTTPELRLRLAAKAYTHTAEYDMAIAAYMRREAGLEERLFLSFERVQELRYGENPHQRAAFYRTDEPEAYSLATARQLNGKELSYNNIQDANAALELLREFAEPCCVAVKHMNPCGVAIAESVAHAWQRAYEADPVSIFGGIVALNRPLTREAAEAMKPVFLEIVIAPAFEPEALKLLAAKKNIRLLEVNMAADTVPARQMTSVNGGLLIQELDRTDDVPQAEGCVTRRHPDQKQLADLAFAWRVVKHVKSNAVVAVQGGRTLGVGAGQMNRIGSARIALEEAREKGVTKGIALASDGFFPFDDCVRLAAGYGVEAIVQPGGSVRDADSVAAADELGVAMVFMGVRHFKH